MDEASGRRYWIELAEAVFVATIDGRIVGTYYIKPNQPQLGAHVANAGYMVDHAARGKGVARAMCEHSLKEARSLGFLAMQFNLVVVSNKVASDLWQKMGFEIIGTLPKAYQHARLGLVDAHIMYKILDENLADSG